MGSIIRKVTDKLTTPKGVRITLIVWVAAMLMLSMGPRPSEYKSPNFKALPAEAASMIAEAKLKEYFTDDRGTPAILVFHREQGEVDVQAVLKTVQAIAEANIEHVDLLDLAALPDAVLKAFVSKDGSTMIVPATLSGELGGSQLGEKVDAILQAGEPARGANQFYVTGPAGIAGDTVRLFERADFVLLLATVGIILVLLVIIYRSPLLALIPLLATVIVHQTVNQLVGVLGAAGLELSSQTVSIMSVLLFAAVIDYSLFVFSRYREELCRYENKHEAMREAMRATGKPVLIAGGTVLASMLILFFADFRDYSNFAPVFGTAMAMIMLASVTLVPALFTAFGRKSFWPRVPKFGEETEIKHGIWGPIARFVTARPAVTGITVFLILVVTALNVWNLKFEYDMVKSFPSDMPSRVGYEIVEARYNKGELAPTTILLVNETGMPQERINALADQLRAQPNVASVRVSRVNADRTAAELSLSFDISPYSAEAVERLSAMREEADRYIRDAGLSGQLYFAGTTASLLDERNINRSDIAKIVVLETVLILLLLYVLTRSFKMSLYMMATILLSYASALGLGLFLADAMFGFDAISTRVPVYAFIFLVALGIDYNIIMVSRFLEERQRRGLRDALETAVRNTGGVISSAGVILAATFAALMTMPIADLFVFGFIVALGILMDTFLVRGLLLPALILFLKEGTKSRPIPIPDLSQRWCAKYIWRRAASFWRPIGRTGVVRYTVPEMAAHEGCLIRDESWIE
ncbi:membrane protein [Paenibacillus cisolokensis]|uniref:Membrane protein n=1 Tax=Paenibacillus cisolokensis TaxID=1658519 RepID=A0ABQ4NDT4_9BACL|nr:MMPL family transporter [Paenibacillus cisolokensis]GIQ66369.1 membrane protein [Paenibacillus cisolokensis]